MVLGPLGGSAVPGGHTGRCDNVAWDGARPHTARAGTRESAWGGALHSGRDSELSFCRTLAFG